MEHTYYVSCSMEQCGDLIHSAIVDGSITGELLDHYVVKGPNGLKCAVMVYEKHYWRVGNRLTLTVTIHRRGRRQCPDPLRLGGSRIF